MIALLPARHQGDCLVCASPAGRSAPATATTAGPVTADQADPADQPAAGIPFSLLPRGAVVGTSSAQRRDQLLRLRPDLEIRSIRGSIEGRLAQVDAGAYQAAVVARCALERLDLTRRISLALPFETHPLQGHLAVTALAGRRDLRRLWAPADIRRQWGRVSLVGAGPGDPELLTLKARRLIASADIVLHDALANPDLLPAGVEAVFVGKRKGNQAASQDQTNALMHRLALQGRQVVRLKGGDPFTFGRGGEEFRYLQERLVAVEVVPGISSATAAAACTGLSLTDRTMAASLALCTGYPADRIQTPAADTRVYFMGASNQARIARLNLQSGLDPGTPVLLVANASLPDQACRFATLGELADAPATLLPDSHARDTVPAETSAQEPPVLTIIGAVANPVQAGQFPAPGGSLRPDGPAIWWERRWRLWYTGTDPQAVWRQGLDRRHPEGLALTALPLVDLVPTDDWLAPAGWDWLFFTSRAAVRFFASRLYGHGLDSRALAGARIAAVGQATASALREELGLRADLVPGQESGRGLAQAFLDLGVPAGRILIPSSDQALGHLDRLLDQAGHQVRRLTLYHNRERDTPPGLDLDQLDEIFLASPSAARALARWYPALPDDLLLSSMGEETRAAAAALWPRRQP